MFSCKTVVPQRKPYILLQSFICKCKHTSNNLLTETLILQLLNRQHNFFMLKTFKTDC